MPALDEEESLQPLIKEIKEVFAEDEINFEIIIVDDGSKIPVSTYIENTNKVKVLTNNYRMGQSYSLFKGIKDSKYSYIATLDSDGQNPPKEIKKLIEFLNTNPEFDVVSGVRIKRKDSFFRSLYSRIANFLIRLISKSQCKDLGCGLKIFEKKMIDDIMFNGDIHRILIPLFEYRNYNLGQVEVEHRARKHGQTKYGFGRIIAVIIDSFLLYLTKGFTQSTRYALGRLSFYFGLITLLLFGLALYQKFYLDAFVHKNPIFLLGITTFFTFLQLLITSLISFFIENKD